MIFDSTIQKYMRRWARPLDQNSMSETVSTPTPILLTATSTVQINEMSSSCQTEDSFETLALVTSHDTLAPI